VVGWALAAVCEKPVNTNAQGISNAHNWILSLLAYGCVFDCSSLIVAFTIGNLQIRMSLQAPYRILHLVSSERWTGVAEPATSLALAQKREGSAVWMGMIWGRSFEEKAGALGLPLARELEIPRRYNPLRLRADIHALRRFIEQHQINVVHSHLLHDHWLSALALRGKGANRPALIRTVHRYEKMRRDPVHRWLFDHATDAVITVSTEQKAIITEAYPSLSENLYVVPGAVDTNKFKPDPEGGMMVRNDMGERLNARVAGIVAHLGYNRGHAWLLRAAPAVINAVPGCSIWIVGQGEIKYRLRDQVHAPQFKERVVMAGYRTTDLPQTYAAMDVALLLALGSEGSARACLEAMACGKPVIAVRKGALVDTIEHGKNGLLVNENDENALAEAMIQLLSDPDLSMEMGKAARNTIIEKFTEQRRHDATMEVYHCAVKRVKNT
jgi:glycosyltransferase involved in cell wall biosynthesis